MVVVDLRLRESASYTERIALCVTLDGYKFSVKRGIALMSILVVDWAQSNN